MAGQISESDQIKQFKEFLGTYNKLTENCFLDCIKDFTSRDVKPEEQRQNTDPSFPKECLHPEAGNTQFLSAHREQNHSSSEGQTRALFQSAPDISSAARAIGSISWKIIIEAPWILSRIKAKPEFMSSPAERLQGLSSVGRQEKELLQPPVREWG
ncbi:mitochondrial import inner membrane translocase subunit Tim9 isoform X1 [Pipra filicauda]|uniref:Mitochondrial import inner membrane translocase subunit Tim9 isoform X1 n=1 Tax=Pipra filicauda TaxID=649802 RepID=A0A7R5KSS8_9PASS|nr:mitochondrial import inner membrane translocase subunit Tim9 isoform X1 [Pipra filicauda]XP_039243609.1 mitochondrial import inner membrane translocase subunit Tim9 isoform X1 [Pipra filicauda]XP_039243610.1 mitochondrial import inner membrane translocase subunit Tim9 isoform X1 [Pipra filicauda]